MFLIISHTFPIWYLYYLQLIYRHHKVSGCTTCLSFNPVSSLMRDLPSIINNQGVEKVFAKYLLKIHTRPPSVFIYSIHWICPSNRCVCVQCILKSTGRFYKLLQFCHWHLIKPKQVKFLNGNKCFGAGGCVVWNLL